MEGIRDCIVCTHDQAVRSVVYIVWKSQHNKYNTFSFLFSFFFCKAIILLGVYTLRLYMSNADLDGHKSTRRTSLPSFYGTRVPSTLPILIPLSSDGTLSLHRATRIPYKLVCGTSAPRIPTGMFSKIMENRGRDLIKSGKGVIKLNLFRLYKLLLIV